RAQLLPTIHANHSSLSTCFEPESYFESEIAKGAALTESFDQITAPTSLRDCKLSSTASNDIAVRSEISTTLRAPSTAEKTAAVAGSTSITKIFPACVREKSNVTGRCKSLASPIASF